MKKFGITFPMTETVDKGEMSMNFKMGACLR